MDSEQCPEQRPEYQALLDMTKDLCTALPIKDLISSLVTLRVLDYSHVEDLFNQDRAEGDIVERFILKHLYRDLLLGDTSRFFSFIKAMKQSSKCEFLVKKLEERIGYYRQASSVPSNPPRPVTPPATSSIDFSDCQDITEGFMLLVAELSKVLESANFPALKRAFKMRTPGGVQLPDDLKTKIKEAKQLDTLLDALVESKYWNFADLRLVGVLVMSSGIREAKALVDKYKQVFFSTKLVDVLNVCTHTVLPPDQHKEYVCRVGSKISKEPDEITVADLAHYCTALETVIMDINDGSCVLEHVEKGCIELHWLIPIHCRYHAYKSALDNRHKFHSLHLQYLKIESCPVIYDQFTVQPTVLSTLLGLPNPVVSTPAEVVDYYYYFLADNLGNDIFCQIMSSLRLLMEGDKVTLSLATSEYQRNTLLLNQLLFSDTTSIIKFCQTLQDTKSHEQVGYILMNAIQSIPTHKDMDILQSQSKFSQELDMDSGVGKDEQVSELNSEMILAGKSVQLKFLNTIVQVDKILQKCDSRVFLEACNKLYAYVRHSKAEPLLPSNYITSLDAMEDILKRLSFLWSWHDCSVLRTLLEACNCQDGLTLLDEFESQIDLNQPMELFPIPRLSSKMVPSSSSAYTILSIRSEQYHNQQAPLRYTREVATTLGKMFGISQHTLQLLAVQPTPLIMYWMIPKSIVPIINKDIHKHVNVLKYIGFSEITAYPSITFFPESNQSLRSFAMLCSDLQDPFLFITSVEDESKLDTKVDQEEIASLQSELSIKSQELKKLRSEKKELAAMYSQSKVKLGKMERQLSGDIEMLASSRSELTNKVNELQRQISTDSKILTDLESELKLKLEEIERINHKKAMLNTGYTDVPDQRETEFQGLSDYHEPLDYSSQHHTHLPQELNSSLTVQDQPSGDTTIISKPIDDSYQETTSHPLSVIDDSHEHTVVFDYQPLLQLTSSSSVKHSHVHTAKSTYNVSLRTEKKCSAFLIGANITGASVPDNAAICRQPLDKSSKNPLDGVLKDLHWMKVFMNDRNIPVYEVLLGNRHVKQDKSDILGAFKNFFSQQGMRRFVIYYSGHGSNGTCNTNKGDWCFETSGESGSRIIYIGLLDILQLWDEMRAQYSADSCKLKDRYLLFIIADSCFSGSWVEEIKTKRPCKTATSGEKYRDVHMIASCRSSEICYYTVAYGGDFTRRYITADSSKHNLKDTAAHVVKVAAQSVVQGVTFPLYMPVKGLANYYNARAHYHTPVATNERQKYRILLMKYDGEILPIGRGLGIASGWSWMLSGQIFHN